MGINSFDKFEKRALKLQDCIAVELGKRSEVDDIINFFAQTNRKLFMGDSFYKLEGETLNSSIEPKDYSSIEPRDYRDDAYSNFSAPTGSDSHSYLNGIQF